MVNTTGRQRGGQTAPATCATRGAHAVSVPAGVISATRLRRTLPIRVKRPPTNTSPFGPIRTTYITPLEKAIARTTPFVCQDRLGVVSDAHAAPGGTASIAAATAPITPARRTRAAYPGSD